MQTGKACKGARQAKMQKTSESEKARSESRSLAVPRRVATVVISKFGSSKYDAKAHVH